MLDQMTAAVMRPPASPSSAFVTSWVVKTPEKSTDWYHSTSVQKLASVATTSSSAPATTSAVTRGLRLGRCAAARRVAPGSPPSPKGPLGGGPKSLSLTLGRLEVLGLADRGPEVPLAATITRQPETARTHAHPQSSGQLSGGRDPRTCSLDHRCTRCRMPLSPVPAQRPLPHVDVAPLPTPSADRVDDFRGG
jgi:hypothetical protein